MNRSFTKALLLPALVTLLALSASSSSDPTSMPKEGFVPDEATAIAIAEAVLKPIYGAKQMESERPYHAKLINGVWWVGGTLPPKRVGGVAVIKISKRDARVLSLTHGE